jgi:hypothetical protein
MHSAPTRSFEGELPQSVYPSPAIPSTGLTTFSRDPEYSGRIQWMADATAGNCNFQWQCIAGLILGRDQCRSIDGASETTPNSQEGEDFTSGLMIIQLGYFLASMGESNWWFLDPGGTYINQGEKKYPRHEKIQFFCMRCGLIRQDHGKCGVVPRAPTWGGWSGRGDASSGRKRSSDDASLDDDLELKDKDTGGSPMKTDLPAKVNEVDHEGGAKKTIDFEGSTEAVDESCVNGNPSIPPLPSQFVKAQEKKQRKSSDNKKLLATSAASEEDRRAQ